MRHLLFVVSLATALIGFTGIGMADERIEEQKRTEASIKFVYFYCNDIAAIQEFYTGLLGMAEKSYTNNAEWGWLTYDCGSVQFIVFRAPDEVPVLLDWAAQPGWDGGNLPVPSWSVEIPEARFAATVEMLIAAGVSVFSDKPLWAMNSYWSFPVRDPMGNTVEIYTSPAQRPQSTDWPQ